MHYRKAFWLTRDYRENMVEISSSKLHIFPLANSWQQIGMRAISRRRISPNWLVNQKKAMAVPKPDLCNRLINDSFFSNSAKQ